MKKKKETEQERIDRLAEEAWERDHPDIYKPTTETDAEYEPVQGELDD